MASPHHVAVIVGSLRKESFSLKIAHALAKLAPDTLKLNIVTLHDISITPVDASKGGYDNLTMDVTAKTYRYIEDEGAAKAAKKPGGAS